MSEVDQRLSSVARLYGTGAVSAFAGAHVWVIGIGGVGSWAVEALARSGVGQITLMDLDDICVTNTNRQIHTLQETIGHSKVAVMAKRLRAIHPQIQVNEIEDFLSSENVREYFEQLRPDAVVDAIDSIQAKAALVACAKRQKVPVVTTGGAGGQIDPTQIRVADLAKTTMDPLAAKLRAELRRHYGFSRNPKRKFGVECVYSQEPMRYPDGSGGVCLSRPDESVAGGMDCAGGLGSSVNVTAAFGLAACARVLKKLARE